MSYRHCLYVLAGLSFPLLGCAVAPHGQAPCASPAGSIDADPAIVQLVTIAEREAGFDEAVADVQAAIGPRQLTLVALFSVHVHRGFIEKTKTLSPPLHTASQPASEAQLKAVLSPAWYCVIGTDGQIVVEVARMQLSQSRVTAPSAPEAIQRLVLTSRDRKRAAAIDAIARKASAMADEMPLDSWGGFELMKICVLRGDDQRSILLINPEVRTYMTIEDDPPVGDVEMVVQEVLTLHRRSLLLLSGSEDE